MMRFLEWALWKSTIISDAELEKVKDVVDDSEHKEAVVDAQKAGKPAPKRKKRTQPQAVYADDLADKVAKDEAERFPKAEMFSRVFACNDTYLEMRSGMMEPRRGFITMASAIAWFFIGAFGYMGIASLIDLIFYDSEQDKAFDLLAFLFSFVVTAGIAFLYFRFFFKYTRMEAFTTRFALVRFNRVTRQVYLHRPKNCGGVIVMPWEGVMHDFNPGECTMMLWQRQDGQYGFPLTFAGVGSACSDTDKLRAQWEWIRRYMDEGGLKNLPKPKTMTMIPTPWYAFRTFLEGTEGYLENAGGLLTVILILLTPLWLLIAFIHWISLMLCWRPRWPKIIREAGQPGKPVPPLTTVDDYPPETAARLKANAYRWLAKPGRDPNKMVNQS